MDNTSQNEKIYDDIIYRTESPNGGENICISDEPDAKAGTGNTLELQFQPVAPPRLTRSRSTLRKRPSTTGAGMTNRF